ncbi:alpha/beta hydrolase [Nocardioides convexus]|uniref:alpha/beta fold hydrolase n=1 Tax=Nocardioides convexus TaxID=2712224 RepID=UPI0024188C93|nr:alpha/beta hydrolase [Nocardioides convexus]
MIAHTSGQGTPLVMVHGFAVDHRILLPLEDMVGDRPFRRVYVDLPWAEGADDTGAATPGEVADAVLEEVREVAAGGSFAVLGNSFGAMVARHVAHEPAGAVRRPGHPRGCVRDGPREAPAPRPPGRAPRRGRGRRGGRPARGVHGDGGAADPGGVPGVPPSRRPRHARRRPGRAHATGGAVRRSTGPRDRGCSLRGSVPARPRPPGPRRGPRGRLGAARALRPWHLRDARRRRAQPAPGAARGRRRTRGRLVGPGGGGPRGQGRVQCASNARLVTSRSSSAGGSGSAPPWIVTK